VPPQRLGGFIDFVPVDSVARSQYFREFVVAHSAEFSRTTLATENLSFTGSLRIPAQSQKEVGLSSTLKRTLSTIADRIGSINRDPRAKFTIRKAIAFGDFLSKSATSSGLITSGTCAFLMEGLQAHSHKTR
jgi:hypothetical protein